jgi:hypothetical protein
MTDATLAIDPMRSIDRRLPLGDLPDARFDTVLDFWRANRVDAEMPPPKAVRPEMLRGALGYVNLIDVLYEDAARPGFRFRLIGSEIVQAYGREMAGKRVEDIAPAYYGSMVQRQFEEVVAAREPCLHEVRFTLDWREHWLLRLSVPLGEAGGAVTRIMTVAAFDPDFDRCGIKNFTDRLIAQEQAACSATVRGG